MKCLKSFSNSQRFIKINEMFFVSFSRNLENISKIKSKVNMKLEYDNSKLKKLNHFNFCDAKKNTMNNENKVNESNDNIKKEENKKDNQTNINNENKENQNNENESKENESNDKDDSNKSKDSTFWKQFRIFRRNLYRSILYLGLFMTIYNSYLYYNRNKNSPENSYIYNKDIYKFVRYMAELKVMIQKVSIFIKVFNISFLSQIIT